MQNTTQGLSPEERAELEALRAEKAARLQAEQTARERAELEALRAEKAAAERRERAAASTRERAKREVSDDDLETSPLQKVLLIAAFILVAAGVWWMITHQ